MSEFEKWFETVKETYPYWPDKAAILTWKAALEWVLGKLEIEEPYEVFHSRIKKELGNL